MTQFQRLSKDIFVNSLTKAKKLAGPRYTPGLKGYEDFPSLEIQSLIESFEGLARTEDFWKSFLQLKEDLEKWTSRNRFLKPELVKIGSFKDKSKIASNHTQKLLSQVALICQLDKSKYDSIDYTPLILTSRRLRKTFEKVRMALHQSKSTEEKVAPKNDELLRHYDELLSDVFEIISFTNRIDNFVADEARILANRPLALLLGGVGVGKTHFLCDLAEKRISKGYPTLIFLAHALKPIKDDIWNGLLSTLNLNCSKNRFFSFLRRQAIKSGSRALVIIDGINEGEKNKWIYYLKRFVDEARMYPEIGIAISCRTPYESLFLQKRQLKRFITLTHRGFAGIEINAQTQFFEYYKLPSPEVPLLDQEFSNPLFLKIMCESLSSSVVKNKHRQIKEIASGQRGMTKIFEDYVKQKEKDINRELYQEIGTRIFPVKGYLWGKGTNKGLIKDLADEMVRQNTDYVTPSQLKLFLKQYLSNKRYLQSAFRRVVNGGVLAEGITWDKGNPKQIFRFPYQKFSDHLIIRNALQNIDCKNPDSVKALIQGFENRENIIEALVIEFPKRSKDRELFDFYEKNKISRQLARSFLQGLYWRDRDCFNDSTIFYINACLKDTILCNETLEAITSLAVRPHHPCGVKKLDGFLRRLKLVNRDLMWSEFIRKSYGESVIHRALDWILNHAESGLSYDACQNFVPFLKWYLTSTVRLLRDQATKALFVLGKRLPNILFKETLESLSIDDPYVKERMLAATYGVTMAHHNSNHAQFLKKILPAYARQIYMAMFAKGAPNATTHALSRDYARRIIQVALLHHPNFLKKREKQYITPPFRFGGIRKWGKSKDRDAGKYRAGSGPIQMDFENYTVGRLVRDRMNYDNRHADFKKVLANIYWRIYRLGYNHDTFQQIDQEIARLYYGRYDNAVHVERYGKKYSWIAYFELYGFRQDKGLLENNILRPSDVDIDPSFPNRPLGIHIIKENFVKRPVRSLKMWVERGKIPNLGKYLQLEILDGDQTPWVLLRGYLDQSDKNTGRIVFAHLECFMIQKQNLTEILTLLRKNVKYALHLPEPSSDSFIFAGEIPWCDTFTPNDFDDLSLVVGKKKVKQRIKKLKFISNGTEIPREKGFELFHTRIPRQSLGDPSLILKFLEREGIKVEFDEEVKTTSEPIYKDFKVFLPIKKYEWESYHSEVNPSQYLFVPARKLAEMLKLRINLQDWSMRNFSDKRASITLQGNQGFENRQELLYLRKDLLVKFLEKNQISLFWIVWGDRQAFFDDEKRLKDEFFKNEKHYKRFRSLYIFQDGIPNKLAFIV